MRSGGAIKPHTAACPAHVCMWPSSRVGGLAGPPLTTSGGAGHRAGEAGWRNRKLSRGIVQRRRAALASVQREQLKALVQHRAGMQRGNDGRMAAAPCTSMCHLDPGAGQQPAAMCGAASRGEGAVSVARSQQAIKTPRSWCCCLLPLLPLPLPKERSFVSSSIRRRSYTMMHGHLWFCASARSLPSGSAGTFGHWSSLRSRTGVDSLWSDAALGFFSPSLQAGQARPDQATGCCDRKRRV
ncbi:uncharacterized protein IWZ02DRAFT_30876 [Phyllosticta citriasiana]|uniref:uncharacterized protein n=1 Tax=Phyllosticta citriasiana TaxID=595635 RepID=UPI0030FD5DCC